MTAQAWILIIILNGADRAAIDHIEFESQRACESAVAGVYSRLRVEEVDAFCVAKGEPMP